MYPDEQLRRNWTVMDAEHPFVPAPRYVPTDHPNRNPLGNQRTLSGDWFPEKNVRA